MYAVNASDTTIQKIFYNLDQHLARHFEYNGSGLSSPPPFLCSQMITLFFKFNDIRQSENRVVILANCGIRVPLF